MEVGRDESVLADDHPGTDPERAAIAVADGDDDDGGLDFGDEGLDAFDGVGCVGRGVVGAGGGGRERERGDEKGAAEKDVHASLREDDARASCRCVELS